MDDDWIFLLLYLEYGLGDSLAKRKDIYTQEDLLPFITAIL